METVFKKKLNKGESVTGKVDEVDTDAGRVTFEMKDDSKLKLSGVPTDVCELLDEDHDGDIITLKHRDDGEFSVKVLDDFPG